MNSFTAISYPCLKYYLILYYFNSDTILKRRLQSDPTKNSGMNKILNNSYLKSTHLTFKVSVSQTFMVLSKELETNIPVS